jgi:quaternary ammonium compound-resistance protein SugE
MAMAWLSLIVAGAFEVAATTIYRYTDGLTRPGPVVLLALSGVASLYFLHRAVAGSIPVGTAYAVWTGVGAAGTALLGVAIYGEPATAARLAFLALLVVAIVGLQLVSHQ